MKNFKKLFVICFICFAITLSFYHLGETVKTNAEKDIYALIKSKNCLLLNENQSPIFLLPQSYYVKILDKINDYYYVEFKDVNGYVLIKDVELTSTPKNPYPKDFTFNLKAPSHLYSSPINNSKLMTLNESIKLNYLGSIVGESLEEYGGNIWYYVKCENENTYGYVYAPYTTGISGLSNSSENTTKLVNSYEEIKSMSKSTFLIIVILLFIPMVFILYLLFTPKIKNYKKEDFK